MAKYSIKKILKMKGLFNQRLTAVYVPCEEGGYSAFIEEIPGVNSQGESLEEAKRNLRDALQMVLEIKHELAEKEIYNKQ